MGHLTVAQQIWAVDRNVHEPSAPIDPTCGLPPLFCSPEVLEASGHRRVLT